MSGYTTSISTIDAYNPKKNHQLQNTLVKSCKSNYKKKFDLNHIKDNDVQKKEKCFLNIPAEDFFENIF